MVRNFSIAFAMTFIVAFPIAFIYTRYMEAAHRFDSIGLWYTLYVSTVFSLIGAAICAVLFSVLSWLRGRHARPLR